MSQLSTNKQRYTLIPTPFDSKRTNCYVDGSNIVIETIPEYLARIPADIRDTFIVTVMLPKVGHSAGTFPIATFSTVLADFDFKLYGFVGGLADINFVELDFSTVESFLDLTDTPDSYTGEANKFVRVKNDESGLEFITIETNSITVTVNQPSHGLSAGYPIRISGTNTYVGAQADSEANAEVVGYVTEIVDGDNFKYVPIGEVTTGVPAVAAGTVLFLSPIVQGGLTSTEPTTVGQVSKPLMVVIESGARALFINYRGMKITTATQGDIIDAENLGTGEGIFANKDVDTLQFKSLVEGTNITLSSDGNEITINATDTGEANTASNLGTGEGIYAQKVGVDLQFKSLKEGTNVTISADANEITINSTATTNDVVAGDGMDFTTNDPVTLGTPSTVDGNSTNSVTTNSHTHELGDVPTSKLTGTIPAGSIDGLIPTDNVGSGTEIVYGALYNWYAYNGISAISNTGWHVPSKSEYDTFITYLGGDTSGGGKLKETGTTYWGSPNTGATNETLFNLRGSGYRIDNGTFSIEKQFCRVGLSGEYLSSSWWWSAYYNNASVAAGIESKQTGHSVRLVKDMTTLTNGQAGTYVGNDGKIYRTICIGTQEWIADNLSETKYRDGTTIPIVTDNSAWAGLSTGAMCYYNNDPSYGGGQTTLTTTLDTINTEISNLQSTSGTTTNAEVIKFDSGVTEGTDLYTFDGSVAKTIDIKAGTNVSIAKAAGEITINAVGSGNGDVNGPNSATDNAIVRFDNTTGKVIQNSTVTLADDGTIENPNSIKFDTTPTTIVPTTGQMYWDANNQTVSVDVSTNVTLQLGQEAYVRIVNKTGSQINDGSVVRISGAQGNRPTASLAQANTFNSSVVIGVATENIADNAEGFVTTHGIVNGFDTSLFSAAGAYLYLDPVNPGKLVDTITSPVPEFITPVAVALNKTNNGSIFVSPFYPRSTDGTFSGNSNSYSPSEKAIKTYVDNGNNRFPVDINRCGFLNRTETTISFDGTKTFTLTKVGASWSYYRNGLKYTIASSRTVDIAVSPVDGTLYYIYIDSTDGTLISGGAWDLNDTKIPVATVFWNSTLTPKYVMSDERHTVGVDRAYHREHHYTEGTVVSTPGTVSGLTAGSTTASDKTFGITGTTLFDEDLKFTLSTFADPDGATAVYPILYRTSATTYAWTMSDMPFKYSNLGGGTYGYIEYDLNGTSTPQSTNNRYLNTYIFASNIVANSEADPEISTSPMRYFIMQGRNFYTTAALAQAEKFVVSAGMPVAEGVAIYQLTWWRNTEPNSVKGRCTFYSIQQVNTNITTTTAVSITAHNTLAGLDGGETGYYGHLTSAEQTIVANISGTNSGDQNVFSTIAVSGQSNVVADSTSDTLTLVAGTNITITTDASSDSVTINSTAGGSIGIWTSLSGTYASATTFTFTGTDTDVKLITLSLLTCTDSAGTTRRIGYVKTAVNNSGTITATVVTNSDLASGDKDFKVTYNRKVTDYQRLVTIPGECIADTGYSQGMFYSDIMSDSYLLPVDTSVLTAAAGTGAALTYNVYKNTTNLFSSAPDMTTNTVLRAQRPTTNTITAGETVSLRIMSSAGATNKAADFQAKLFIIPQAIWEAF